MGGKRVTAVLVAVCVLALFTSCAKLKKKEKPGEKEGVTSTQPTPWSPDEQAKIAEGAVQRPPVGEAVEVPELQRVYFDYDKYNLRPDALATLENNLKWFKANPDKRVLIEGHCDERGTEEYNLSLGDKRAKEVMGWLMKNDVKADRLYTISYGEQYPVDPGHNESAWSKNRRAVFKVYE